MITNVESQLLLAECLLSLAKNDIFQQQGEVLFTCRRVVWDILQLLDDVNVQQFKGQEILGNHTTDRSVLRAL